MCTHRRAGCLVLILLIWIACPLISIANEPDYAIPGHWLLPWSCEESHRVTWEPSDHWAFGKAQGVAYDFSFRTGTPLWAPTAGRAYFLFDERPLETNFGNYVEIVTPDGEWLIRLAHLRDAQSGERDVQAGELIGYSGSSGVQVEHLHLEVLERQEAGWGPPDMGRLQSFFGANIDDWVEGAILTNDGCAARLVFDTAHLAQDTISLGQEGIVLLSLRNDGLEPLDLQTVQLAIHGPAGISVIEEAAGDWRVPPQALLWVPLPIRPTMAGEWRLGRLTCETALGVSTFQLDTALWVNSSPLQLVRVEPIEPVQRVGEQIQVTVELENNGLGPETFDELLVTGVRPDGAVWHAAVVESLSVEPSQHLTATLVSQQIPRLVGEWRITEVGLFKAGRRFTLAQTGQPFSVYGPELVAEDIQVFTDEDSLIALLLLTNRGTETASPSSVELWGWVPDGEDPFVVSQQHITPISPGGSALIQFSAPLETQQGMWRVVEAGYWYEGDHIAIRLPQQPIFSAQNPENPYAVAMHERLR